LVGLTQGIASVGLSYLTEELDLNPLLGNIAYSLIATGIEGLFSKDGLFKHMANTFTDATAKMLGYNPAPDMYDEAFWDYDTVNGVSVFNEARYKTVINQYQTQKLWQDAAYMAQVMDFTEVMKNDGIETALNTYATGLFNGIAVNSLTNLAMVPINTIGTYIKEKLDAYEQNPSATTEVTKTIEADGTVEYDVEFKDQSGDTVCTLKFEEATDETTGEKYKKFKGYEVPNQTQVYGDFWANEFDQYAGLREGWMSENVNGLDVQYDIFIDENGMPVQGAVKIIDMNTGKTTIIRPPQDSDYLGCTDPNGFFLDSTVETGVTIGDDFYSEKTYFILDGKLIATEEYGDYTHYSSIFEPMVIEDAVVIRTEFDPETAQAQVKVIAKRFLMEDLKSTTFIDDQGRQVVIDAQSNGNISYYVEGNRIWSGNVDDWADIIAFGKMPLPNGMTLPGVDADLIEMADNIMRQFQITEDENSDRMNSFDFVKKKLKEDYNITDSEITGEQIVTTSLVDTAIKIIEGAETEVYFIEGVLFNDKEDNRNTIISDPTDPTAISQHIENLTKQEYAECTAMKYERQTLSSEGLIKQNVKEVVYNIEMPDLGKTYTVSYSIATPTIDQLKPDGTYDIYITTRIKANDEAVYAEKVTKTTFTKEITGSDGSIDDNLWNLINPDPRFNTIYLDNPIMVQTSGNIPKIDGGLNNRISEFAIDAYSKMAGMDGMTIVVE